MRLRFRPPAADIENPEAFERVVRGIFLRRRKTLLNAFRPVADSVGQDAARLIGLAGLDPIRRPETLTLAEMARLVNSLPTPVS